MTKHSRNKVAWAKRAGLFAIAIALAVGGVFAALLLLAPPQVVQAALCVSDITQPCQDRYEPNDSAATATIYPAVANQSVVSLTFYTTGTTPSVQDEDWFKFSVDPNTLVTITATSNAGFGAISAVMFSADGSNQVGVVLGGATSASAAVSNTTAGAQNYFVRVKNGDANAYYSYNMIRQNLSIPPVVQPTAVPQGVTDIYEPNDSPQQVLAKLPAVVSYINVGSQVGTQATPLNFYPYTTSISLNANGENGDKDWFFFYARRHVSMGGSGGTYHIVISIPPGGGVDTEMFLFRDKSCSVPTGDLEMDGSGLRLFGYNDDQATLNRASQIDFNSDSDCVYWLRIWNKDPAPRGANQTYSITITEFLSTPAPTTSPAPTTLATPYPQGIDSFEYNGDFDRASLIAPGVKYSNLNFVPYQPPSPDTVDNDFFRLPVKQGIYYTCETLDLFAGVDTNMIAYNQDRVGIGGNDDTSTTDRSQGKFGSRVTWLAGYTGIAYILVGEVSPPRPNETQLRTYALQCTIGIPNTPTPVGGPPTATPIPSPFVPPTPEPPDPTMTPFPTPRTSQNLAVRRVDGVPGRGASAPTVQPTATPRPIALDVQIFNDNNRNGLLDPGEGINGTSIRILDETSGTPLGQTATDGEGRARFTIFNEGPVRVSVPIFGYSTLINEAQATVRIALVPPEQLPARIP